MASSEPPLLPVAILAGGLATRLQPVTQKIPKALVDINGRPFIAWQLEGLRTQGVSRVVVCAGYLGEQIQEVVGDGSQFGLHVDWAFDGPTLLGTAGALKRALPLLGGPFFVLYGDSYLPIAWRPVQESFFASDKPALMTVFHNNRQFDRSNVEFEHGRITAYNKRHPTPQMRYIDYGLGVFHPSAFDEVLDGESADLAGVYQSLAERGRLAAYEVHQRFFEIGSFEGLQATRDYFARSTFANPGEGDMIFADLYLREVEDVARRLDRDAIEKVAKILADVRSGGGRLFILGVGGSAGNASHAVNDFRKIVGIEAYAPTDNVSELTARTNDEGWATVFAAWLQTSRLTSRDALLVLSVGGGNLEKNVSPNLVAALDVAKAVGARIHRHRRPRRRLHGQGGRRVRHRPDGQPRHTSRRTPRPSRPSSGTCWSRIRRSRRTKQNGNRSGEAAGTRGLSGSRRRVE